MKVVYANAVHLFFSWDPYSCFRLRVLHVEHHVVLRSAHAGHASEPALPYLLVIVSTILNSFMIAAVNTPRPYNDQFEQSCCRFDAQEPQIQHRQARVVVSCYSRLSYKAYPLGSQLKVCLFIQCIVDSLAGLVTCPMMPA